MSTHHSDDIRDVTYVAVPYEEYKKFLRQEQRLKTVEAQLHKHLQYKPIPEARKEEPPEPSQSSSGDIGEITAEGKKGAGDVVQHEQTILPGNFQTTAAESNVSPDVIQAAVTLFLKQLPGLLTSGKGDSDLTPTPPAPLPLTSIDPITAKVVDVSGNTANGSGNGDDEPPTQNISDSLDELDSKLLETVRSKDKEKASQLLGALKKHNSELHFNSDGTIYLNGESLEGSNILDLFKYLFRPANYASHPNLQAVVNEIASLGLGHLISRFYSAGITPRGKNAIKNRHIVHQHLKTRNLPWYHVG